MGPADRLDLPVPAFRPAPLRDEAVYPASGLRPAGFAALDSVFDDALCDALIAAFDAVGGHTASLVKGVQSAGIRRSRVLWFDADSSPDPDLTAAVDRRMAEVTALLNRTRFGFALDGFDEAFQIARYDAEIAGGYIRHVDRGEGPRARRRKLGISIQLSAPETYDGGDLILEPQAVPITGPRRRGTAIAFPSYVVHEVTPVPRGCRYSFVAWVHGPGFV